MTPGERALALVTSIALGILWGFLWWLGIGAAVLHALMDLLQRLLTAWRGMPIAFGAVALLCVLAFIIRIEETEGTW